MDSLVQRMINCELIHFELDDGTDLLDIVPESQKKVILLKETLCIYEALIGYKISSWTCDVENCPQQINSLFQGYLRLIHFFKNITRPKKADTKKKKGDTNKSTQADTTLKKDNNVQKVAIKNFKLPSTILNFRTVIKLLELLHKTEVPWATSAQANIVKSKVEIHRYAMQAAIDLVQISKASRILSKEEYKDVYEHYTQIASVLYERCITRIDEFADFDFDTAILSAECFLQILQAIGVHKMHIGSFLSEVANTEKSDEILNHLTPVVEIYKNILVGNQDETEDDRKLSVVAINTLTVLATHIPYKSNVLSESLLDWLGTFVNTRTINNKHTAMSLVSLLFNVHLKFKPDLRILELVATRLGDVIGTINEEEESTEELKLVNELIANSVFQNVCSSIKSLLEDINLVTNRLKAEYSLINYSGNDSSERRKESIRTKERNICCHMCFIVSILTTMSNITIQLGPLSEFLTKNIALFYNTLNALTKYFVLRSSKINVAFQGARFERLVKLAGKQLSPVVYKLIMYLEECQKQTDSTQSKKKNSEASVLKSKVLRETRQIPKVVFEIEQFTKSLAQLSKKTNVDLMTHIGQGTARDFRILNLKEVLQNQTTNSTQNIQDKATESNGSDSNEESMEVDEEHDELSVASGGSAPQPAKRARKK